MSRCRRTGAVLDIVLAGEGLTSGESDHAATCAECAHALALARRFDGELRRVSDDLATDPTTWARQKGGRHVWRGALLAGTVVVAISLAVVGVQVWRDGSNLGMLAADGPSAEQLNEWLDRSLVIAHGQAQPGGTAIGGWEAGRVEVCGSAVVAFFDRGDGSDGYLWAIGAPSRIPDESFETGWSRTLSAPDVARRRAELPVCDLALDEVRDPVGADLAVAPDVVVRVPKLLWTGAPEDAPVEVEVVGGDPDAVDEVGIGREAYLLARLSDPSFRAVDIVSAEARYRYTVSVPGFAIWAKVAGEAVRYEFLNERGDIVRAGRIVDWSDDAEVGHRQEVEEEARRQAAEAARRAAAEHRAATVRAIGQTCRDWRALGMDSRVLLTEQLIVGQLEAVRTSHQLAETATFSEITTSALASLDKGCQGSPGDRLLADIVEPLDLDE